VFRGQFAVMAAFGAIYSIGLWLAGLDLALLIGMFSGLIGFIPYAGSFSGVVAASVAALAQFEDLWSLVPVLAVFGVGQMLEGIWLTPWLIGNRIGLHPGRGHFRRLGRWPMVRVSSTPSHVVRGVNLTVFDRYVGGISHQTRK